MITQIFNPTGEFLIPTGTQSYEINTEIEIQPIIAETEISK